jgi:hypothetical protein
LNDADPKLRLRAAAILLRFATPSRLAPAAAGAERVAKKEDQQHFQDVIDFIEAPVPGQPGCRKRCPSWMDDEDNDFDDTST